MSLLISLRGDKDNHAHAPLFQRAFFYCYFPSYLYYLTMKDNVFLFTGSSNYLVRQEIKKRKKSFAEKYGEQYIFSFSSDNFDIPAIIDTIFSGGLFVTKKLVIIFGVPGDKVSDNKISASKLEQFENGFMSRLDYLSADTIVLFVSYDPDKRLRLYKALGDVAQTKEFNTPNAPGIRKFMK